MQNTDTRKKMICPRNGKWCIEGRRKDFEKDENDTPGQCRFWTHLYGKDPQGENTIDQFDCAQAWFPIIGVEIAQMNRHTTASVDKLATVNAETGGKFVKMLNAVLRMTHEITVRENGIKELPDNIEIPPNGNGDE